MSEQSEQVRRALDKHYFAQQLWSFDRPMNFLQEQIARSLSKQLLVIGSRQIFGKTTAVAIAEALHPMIYIPGFQVIVATDKLATSQKFQDKVRDEFDKFKLKPWPEAKGLHLIENNTTALTLTNKAHLECISNEQRSPKGITADLLIFDEAAYIDDVYYDKARKTTMARPNARFIALSTPNGKQGWFYKAWLANQQALQSGKKPAWEVLSAIDDDCTWFPREYFEKERLESTEVMYRQEMKCEFLEIERSAFNVERFEQSRTDEYTAWEP